jgi:hypothetical protein
MFKVFVNRRGANAQLVSHLPRYSATCQGQSDLPLSCGQSPGRQSPNRGFPTQLTWRQPSVADREAGSRAGGWIVL